MNEARTTGDGIAPVRAKPGPSRDGIAPVRAKPGPSRDGIAPVRTKPGPSRDGIAPVRAKPGPSRDGIAPVRAKPGPSRTAVLARVRSIPEGSVTTYGDLCPGAPRFAGAVLSECDDPEVPWQRVVRADGSLAKGERQRRLLEREGVPFRGARVDMREAWAPPQR